MSDAGTSSNSRPDAVGLDSGPAARVSSTGTSAARVVDTSLVAVATACVVHAAVVFGSRVDAFHAKYGLAGPAFVAALFAGVVLAIVACCVVLRLPPPPALANLRTTFATSIVLTVLAIGFAPVATRLGSIGLLGILGSVHAARVAIRVVRRSSEPSRFERGLAFALFQLAIAVLLAEWTLRIFATFVPSPILSRGNLSAEASIERHRYPPGFVRFGCDRANSLGFFDDEIRPRQPGERRVLLVGDSFVVGIVPHYFHFSTVCERELGVNVISAGVPAVGPFEYAHLLTHDLAEVDVDEIVVSIFVGNDLLEAEFTHRPRNWRSSWLDPTNLLVFEAPRRIRIARNETEKRGANAGTIAGETSAARIAPDDPAAIVKELPWLADYRLEIDGHSEDAFRDIEIVRLLGAFRRHAGPPRAILEALRQIHEAVGSRPFTLLLLPDEFQVDDELYRSLVAEFPEEEFDRDRPQRVLAEFCAREGITVLDALPALRAAPPEADGRPHVYHRFDTHLNRKGNEIVGKLLADHLRKR